MVKEKVLNNNMNYHHDVVVTCLDDEKTNESCKSEIKTENLWPSPEMVGYYNTTPLQLSFTLYSATDELKSSVKKLVCSPDLPLSSYPQQIQPSSIIEPDSPPDLNMLSPKSAYQLDQRHIKGEVGDPHQCNICLKTFAVPARLTRHFRTHTGEKPFRCEYCDKRFSVKENLSVHTRIHTKERPYKCDVCSRAFEHSGKLHRHMRIHTGERPHKCTVCDKTFIQSGQLVIHMRTHTGEKPYVCPVCSKGFTCSKQLKVHSRTHTGEKPYSCDLCGKSFGYNHVLKLHQVSHYGSKVYKCKICKDTFSSKKLMEAHIKTHSENSSGFQNSNLPPSPPLSNPSSELSICDKSESSKGSNEITIESLDKTRSRCGYSPLSAGAAYDDVDILPCRNPDFYSATNKELLLSIMNSQSLRNPAYFSAASAASASLNAGDDIRKRVEAALILENINYCEEDQGSTATDSNPDSPESSNSPDPELSLPPRKRSRMIQKSMESNIDLTQVRYRSVIQYAGGAS